MSKMGKIPVQIPKGVKVGVKGATLLVEGKHGLLTQVYRPDRVEIAVTDDLVTVTRKGEGKEYRAFHGLYRSLVANMVYGVSQRWEKELLVKGLGYRARLQGKKLILDLGYSQPVEYAIPEGVEIELASPTEISIRGADKQLVGQVAAKIRALRKPDPYKGKGVRYKSEEVHLKAGKLGSAGGVG